LFKNLGVKRYFLILPILMLYLCLNGQDNGGGADTGRVYLLNMVERNGEELPEVEIKEVTIVASLEGNRSSERTLEEWYRKHTRLIYNIRKVYPFSQIVKERMAEVNDTLMSIKSEKARKAYLTEFEKSVFAEFEGEVRKMTITQGQILIKLIDRETQNTSYQLIKEYRGSFSAAFWQSIARFFGTNLKASYDPYGEDAVMEIIVRDIEAGWL